MDRIAPVMSVGHQVQIKLTRKQYAATRNIHRYQAKIARGQGLIVGDGVKMIFQH